MNKKERKSCVCTIKTFMNLAYNIHGVMDVVDVDNCEKSSRCLILAIWQDGGYHAVSGCRKKKTQES